MYFITYPADTTSESTQERSGQQLILWRPYEFHIPEMPTQVATIRKDYKRLTKKIEDDPHSPKHWINRAEFFLKKYPEPKNQWPILAAADARKVYSYFCNMSWRKAQGLYPICEEESKILQGKACNILVPALLELGATTDARGYVHEMTVSLSEKHQHILDGRPGRYGKIIRQRFPWIPSHYMNRENYLASVRKDLLALGMSLGPSTVGPQIPNNLGVFATRQFEKGEVLLTEKTMKSNHVTDEVAWYFIDAAIKDLEEASLTGEAALHLLNRPDIGALTAAYNEVETTFSMAYNIDNNLCYLNRRDPRLLWNLDFDFWVLCTAEWRCGTNSFGLDVEGGEEGKEEWSVISRLTSFFQHSCKSNVRWYGLNGSADAMVVTARRTILEGEEIFDTYGTSGSLEERRAYLRRWIGADCECTRCLKEEKAKSYGGEGGRGPELVDSGMEMSDDTASSDGTDSVGGVDAEGVKSMGNCR